MPRIVYAVRRLAKLKTLLALFVLCVTTGITLEAQVFTKLADLGGVIGENSYFMSFAQGTDGNLYGTTSNIDLGAGGTVFKITRDGVITVLHNFCAQTNCADGTNPVSGVILATDGDFYGVTYLGGAQYSGTLFKMTPEGVFTMLYSFCSGFACPDGLYPFGALVEAADGNLYGTTAGGGGDGFGTTFKINREGALTTLHAFMGSDGNDPLAALAEGFDGNFYGTTQRGGSSGNGDVFKMTRSGVITDLVTFQTGNDAWPTAPLVPSRAGFFYGTSTGGGDGTGAIFSIAPNGTFTNLYYFCRESGCSDGGEPYAMAGGTDGNLYGITAVGGASPSCPASCGTIFQFTPNKKLTTIHNFCQETGCVDGNEPLGGLFQATDGKFYGTTAMGGTNRGGIVFSLDMGLKPFVRFILPAGRVGQTGGILGQGFTGTTAVTLNGTPASFTVVSDTFIKATVPAGATTGYVTVATPTGTFTSNVPFHVIP